LNQRPSGYEPERSILSLADSVALTLVTGLKILYSRAILCRSFAQVFKKCLGLSAENWDGPFLFTLCLVLPRTRESQRPGCRGAEWFRRVLPTRVQAGPCVRRPASEGEHCFHRHPGAGHSLFGPLIRRGSQSSSQQIFISPILQPVDTKSPSR